MVLLAQLDQGVVVFAGLQDVLVLGWPSVMIVCLFGGLFVAYGLFVAQIGDVVWVIEHENALDLL